MRANEEEWQITKKNVIAKSFKCIFGQSCDLFGCQLEPTCLLAPEQYTLDI